MIVYFPNLFTIYFLLYLFLFIIFYFYYFLFGSLQFLYTISITQYSVHVLNALLSIFVFMCVWSVSPFVINPGFYCNGELPFSSMLSQYIPRIYLQHSFTTFLFVYTFPAFTIAATIAI